MNHKFNYISNTVVMTINLIFDFHVEIIRVFYPVLVLFYVILKCYMQ